MTQEEKTKAIMDEVIKMNNDAFAKFIDETLGEAIFDLLDDTLDNYSETDIDYLYKRYIKK